MPDAESDLPSAFSYEVPIPDNDTESRPNQAGRGWFVPLSTLWWNLIFAAIVAPLAFVMFVLALVWDQWVWIAFIALPIGVCAAIYAVWCLMMLQRYYLEQRQAATQQPV